MDVSLLHDIVPSKIESNLNCRCQLTCDDWGIPNTKLKYCQCTSAALLCCKNTHLFNCIRQMITPDWWIWIVLFIPHCYKTSFSSGGCFCAFEILVASVNWWQWYTRGVWSNPGLFDPAPSALVRGPCCHGYSKFQGIDHLEVVMKVSPELISSCSLCIIV